MTLEVAMALLLGALGWVISKAWDTAEQRRVRFTELASRLSVFDLHGTLMDRQPLIKEVSKLWVDGSKPVVLAAENFLDAVDSKSPNIEKYMIELVLLLRSDCKFWRIGLSADGKGVLEAADIKLRFGRTRKPS